MDRDIVRSSGRPEENMLKRHVRNMNVTIYEHHYQMNGSWKNWMTCARGVYDDAYCCNKLTEKTRRWVGYFTVIDLSEWKDQKGNVRKNEVVLFAAPLNVLKILESRKSDSGGSLVGGLVTVQRVGETGAAVGNDFVVKKVGDLDKLAPEVTFRGKRLKELIQAANSNPEEAKQHLRRFQVDAPSGEGGFKLEVRPYRYMELLKPRTQKDMKDILAGFKSEEGSSGGTEGDGAGHEDQVPF